MLSPNCLIFPRPRYKNLQKQISKIKDHLIYIPKTSKERRFSHLQDLTSVSQQQLARRFSCYDLIEQKTETVQSFSIKKKKSSKNLLKNTFAIQKRTKPNHTFSMAIDKQNNSQNSKYQASKKQANQQYQKIRIKLITCQNKLKINQNHSNYSSVQTTARTFKPNNENKIQQNQSSSCNFNFQKTDQIPCVYLQTQSPTESNKLFVYYHANGQDLLNTFEFVKALSSYFRTNVIVVEYPGYSIYQNHTNNTNKKSIIKSYENSVRIQQQQISQKILSDIPFVMSYIQNIGYELKNLIFIGRSIGTGPAIQIAQKYDIGSLILLSPFAKFSQVAQKLYGKVAGLIVKQPFDNFNKSKGIKCPVLIIHGMQDKTISYQQSLQLTCNIKTYCSLKLIQHMSHNRFHFQSDIFCNVNQFLREIDFQLFQ